MFKRVLIANRGEIAVRIARTCRRLGIEVVAVYSDADRRALHVLEADHAVCIGPAPVDESYLDVEAIVRAARDSGADALHPGYGLLSENAALAEACATAGVVFIGPRPEAMRAMGDKASARRLVGSRGVPTIPGYDGDTVEPAELLVKAGEIGFPVMIKAAAGGGGRGMRLVYEADRFVEAAVSARREAERAFGDGRLILERAILGARHIEVQIIGDNYGNIVHLGERDCSIQRRHQKVVEETPSPVVDADLRRRMGEAGVEAGRSSDYTNAGTVEFLLDADGSFYFLEMNTRLQVEHGITELVTGTDLVALQLAVAAGERLPFTQEEVRFSGHAIECRLYAEDPANGYLPSAGPVLAFELPEGEGIRNDAGTYAGDEVSTHYDPMLAKVLAWGRDRGEALERMQAALASYRVEGVKTNLSLLRAVVENPVFRSGKATTDFIGKDLDPSELKLGVPDDVLLAAFGAASTGSGVAGDPWQIAGPWRLGGEQRLELRYEGTQHVVEGHRAVGVPDEWVVRVSGGKERRVRFAVAPGRRIVIESAGKSRTLDVMRRADGFDVWVTGRRYGLTFAYERRAVTHADGHREQGLTAPMPGLVLRVMVKEGDLVRTHQALLVLEAMKMEHAVEAPHDGTVKRLYCAEGGRVSDGDLLIEFEPEPAA